MLLDIWVPVPTVLVVGSGVIGDALLAQAALLGWAGERVTGLGEARAEVARFGDADVLVLLDLKARTPAQTAVSIVAERAGRDGSALAGTDGRIGS